MNISDLDQIFMALKDIASFVKKYHTELKEQGFTDEEALKLTIAYQTSITTPRDNKKG